MKKIAFSLMGFLFFVWVWPQRAYTQNAEEILRKVDQVLYASKDEQSHLKIILTDKNGRQSERQAVIKQKGNTMRLFRFTAPAADAGISFLSLPKNVMYLYLPAFGRERRIASHVRNQKFAGTDFSYDDMEAKLLEVKYDPVILKQDENKIILKLIPKPGVQSEYSKTELTLDAHYFYPVSVDYFDRTGRKIKHTDYIFKKIGNYWNAFKITMKDLRTGHQTQLVSTDVKYDQGLSDSDFSVRALTR